MRIVMANVWDANPAPEAVPASMLERRPDVMVAVEMPNDEFSEAMTSSADAAALPWTVDDGELGVWSRFPVRELGDLGLPPARVMRVGVDAPGAPFVLYVVHALNPLRDTSFDDQTPLHRRPARRDRDRVPAGRGGRRLQHERSGRELPRDGRRAHRCDAGRRSRTHDVRGGWWTTVLLRIDHIFVDHSWCAERCGHLRDGGL